MEISDFKKADCKLWRLPSVDLSKVQSAIEEALVRAWQQGSSIDTAIQDAVSNNQEVAAITQQVNEALTFQREQILADVKIKYQEAEEIAKKQEQARLEKVNTQYGTQIEDAARRLAQTKEKEESVRQTYDAAQASLQETRDKIQSKLNEFGGEQGYETVLKINELLTDPTKKAQPRKKREKNLEGRVDKDAESGLTKISDIVREIEKEKPLYKRVYSKVKAILNYKIW
jgi:hypothetical protein